MKLAYTLLLSALVAGLAGCDSNDENNPVKKAETKKEESEVTAASLRDLHNGETKACPTALNGRYQCLDKGTQEAREVVYNVSPHDGVATFVVENEKGGEQDNLQVQGQSQNPKTDPNVVAGAKNEVKQEAKEAEKGVLAWGKDVLSSITGDDEDKQKAEKAEQEKKVAQANADQAEVQRKQAQQAAEAQQNQQREMISKSLGVQLVEAYLMNVQDGLVANGQVQEHSIKLLGEQGNIAYVVNCEEDVLGVKMKVGTKSTLQKYTVGEDNKVTVKTWQNDSNEGEKVAYGESLCTKVAPE